MPRNCSVCYHPKQKRIDELLLERESGYRAVAKRFRLHPAAVYRHFRNHLPKYLKQAKQAQEVLDAGRLIERLQSLHQETSEILAQARKAKDFKTALQAIARAENQVGLVNMLTSSMPPVTEQRISPELEKELGQAVCEWLEHLREQARQPPRIIEMTSGDDPMRGFRRTYAALPAPKE